MLKAINDGSNDSESESSSDGQENFAAKASRLTKGKAITEESFKAPDVKNTLSKKIIIKKEEPTTSSQASQRSTRNKSTHELYLCYPCGKQFSSPNMVSCEKDGSGHRCSNGGKVCLTCHRLWKGCQSCSMHEDD